MKPEVLGSVTSDVTQKTTGNDRNESEVSVGIPAPGRFLPLSQSEFRRNFEPSSSGPARRPQIMIGIIVFGRCLGSKLNIQTYDLICRDVAFAERTGRGKGKLQGVCYARAMSLLRTTLNNARTLRFCSFLIAQ
jgi:hypothetical protein